MSTATETVTKTRFKPVNLYQVILLNDDFTPMDFVIAVLMQLYGKNEEEAYTICMNVHKNGKGVAGVYTKEIAETKAAETIRAARANGHPLKAIAQEA
jgi:ATP-dependent Clp protease adaptor protein ClpS